MTTPQLNGDRFLRRVMVGVLIGVILNIPLSIWWAAAMNTQLNQQGIAIQEVKVEIKELTKLVMSSMDDRYRGTDAKDDFKIRDAKIERLQGKVSKLEIKMAGIP